MLIDKENLVSYKQAITASAASTDTIDLGGKIWNGFAGNDRDIDLFMAVDEAFTAEGAATLVVAIQCCEDSAFGSGVRTLWQSAAIPKADLITTGKMPLGIHIPPDTDRYVRAYYTVATGPFTAGKLTLGVTASRQTNF